MKAIDEICYDLRWYAALVVRSSAEGDAQGTGVYESFYSRNKVNNIGMYIKKVLASYFTQSAKLFRRDAILGDEMGIIVEPMVASKFKHENGEVYVEKHPDGEVIMTYGDCYAPIFSGFGRTYSHKMKGPFIGVVMGLASEYVQDPRFGITVDSHKSTVPIECLIDWNPIDGGSGKHHKDSFRDATLVLLKDGHMLNTKIHDHAVWDMLNEEGNFGALFEKIRNLGKLFEGTHQYLEWAAKLDNGKPAYYLTQIADDATNNFTFSPCEEKEKVVAEADGVQGGGRISLKHIVHISDKNDWLDIRELNEKYDKYMLVFHGLSVDMRTLDFGYSRLSNAAVIAEYGKNIYRLGYFGSHFGGMLAMTNKVLADFPEFDFQKLRNNSMQRLQHGTEVYTLSVEVYASEKMQRAQVLLKEKE